MIVALTLPLLAACASGMRSESPRFRTLEELRTRQQADTARRADAAAAAGPAAGPVVTLATPADTARPPQADAPRRAGRQPARGGATEQGKWIRVGPNPPIIDLQVFESPIADVASYISHRAGVDIVVSSDPAVRAAVLTGEIKGRPWHLAFEALLEAHGLRALQESSGIIRIVSAREAAQGRQPELVELQFRDARDVVAALRPIFRGTGADSTGAGNVEVVGDAQTSRTLVIYGSPDQVASVRALVAQYDRRPANVTIEARLVLVNRQAMQKRGVQYSFNTIVNDSTGGQSTGVTLSGAGAANLPGISGSAFTLRRRFGNTPIGLNVFIDALTSAGWAETETRPLIMTSSEREGKINVGDSYILPVPQPILATGGVVVPGGQVPAAGGDSTQGGYPSTGASVNPGAGGMVAGSGGFAQFLTGTTLRVTPIVLDGGRQIRLKVDLVRDGGTLGPDGRSITGGRNSTTTEVIVDDQAPVVIGSFTVQGRSSASSGVPVLGELPLLGRLFRHDEESSNYMDLVIVLIPHIHPAPERSAP